ncbi:MAG: hypothetical protein OXI80_19430 [Caldilineaceae bacterium]|nr:hypothetical protein [Caldilineaceae bacterium]
MDGSEQVDQGTIETIVEYVLKFMPFVFQGCKAESKVNEGKSESPREVVFSAKGEWNFEVARRNYSDEGQ